jgi:phospholipase/carboxylesterase
MDFQPLKYIYQASDTKDAYTLLLLHGTGGDEHDLFPIAKQFGSQLNVLSLRGNVLEHGMPRFFKRLGMGIFDEKDLEFRTDEMVNFIKQLSVKEGFNADKVIALGYSNGANIAAGALALYPEFLAGAILYRAMLPFKIMPKVAAAKVPVFTSHGKQDPTIPPSDTVQLLNWLQDTGFDVTSHQLPNGHNLTQEDILLSVDWFNKNYIHGKL